VAIPKPSGPYRVGSITHELVDAGRVAHLASEALGRRLLLKVWYPAANATTRPELLWAELRRDARTPLPMRLLLRCVRARTATVPYAAISPLVRASPLVIYNHGLISFTGKNTSLMEELASQGYTVLAIQHADQLAERRALTRGGGPGTRRARKELERQLTVASVQERAKLAPQYYDGADNTNRIVIERSADTAFVMDNASTALAGIPGLQPESVDASAAHLVGFSLGGAVATVTAERDPRARSVANLDGGLLREPQRPRNPRAVSDDVQRRERRRQRWATAWSCATRRSGRHHSSELSRRGRVAAGLALPSCHWLDERRNVRGAAKPDRSGIPFRGNRSQTLTGSRLQC
jgi:dienelactone hydrolase